MFGPMGNAPASPFLSRLGNRVLPESFTAATRRRWRSSRAGRCAGAYAVDDEGIPAQDVTLCEKGLLKTLLTSRTPQKGFVTSNGHGRGGIAAAGVFQLQSASAVPAASLREKYLARLKADGRAFGYIVRGLAGGGPGGGDPEDFMSGMMMMRGAGGPSGPAIVRAYRVDAGRRRDAGPRPAVRHGAARRFPRHPGGVERAEPLQLPPDAAAVDADHGDDAGRSVQRDRRLADRAEPALRRARDREAGSSVPASAASCRPPCRSPSAIGRHDSGDMAARPPLPEPIEVHRDHHWRRDPSRAVTSPLAAERFIDEVGFLHCLTDARRPGPSLFVAVCGRRDAMMPRNVQKDPEASETWLLKDELVRRGKVYYAKLARGKAMFVAPAMLPCFHAVWGVRPARGSAPAEPAGARAS